jgi:Kef-type K+ transport system membrane component KefB
MVPAVKRMRLFLYYVCATVLALAAIYGVLLLGTSLPVSAKAMAFHAHALVAAHDSTGPAGLLAALQENLRDPLSKLLTQWLVVLVSARLLGSVFARVGVPSVVGEITAGILLGPSLFGFIAPNAFAFVFPRNSLGALQLVSQVGICLFMFAVGTELNLTQLRPKGRVAVAVSHASIALPFVLGVALAYPLFSQMAGDHAVFTSFALFMGICMSITAFPVLARILHERRMTETELGNMAIACAAVGDVTAWILLTFVVAIGRAASLDAAVMTIVLTLMFIAIMTTGVRRALGSWISRESLGGGELPNGALSLAATVLVAASFSTEVIGIHALFGAFLAGAIMPGGVEGRRRIAAPFLKLSSTLLLPLYFAFTGLRTSISLLDGAQAWLLCLLIIIAATVGKLGASAAAARLSGMGWRESLQLGVLLNTRGLIELIALNLGYDLGILSPRIFTILVIMALVTTLMTGPLLTLFGGLHTFLRVPPQHLHTPQASGPVHPFIPRGP